VGGQEDFEDEKYKQERRVEGVRDAIHGVKLGAGTRSYLVREKQIEVRDPRSIIGVERMRLVLFRHAK
jgi:hypothetical protein